jgi:dephospho-CoA kinase
MRTDSPIFASVDEHSQFDRAALRKRRVDDDVEAAISEDFTRPLRHVA